MDNYTLKGGSQGLTELISHSWLLKLTFTLYTITLPSFPFSLSFLLESRECTGILMEPPEELMEFLNPPHVKPSKGVVWWPLGTATTFLVASEEALMFPLQICHTSIYFFFRIRRKFWTVLALCTMWVLRWNPRNFSLIWSSKLSQLLLAHDNCTSIKDGWEKIKRALHKVTVFK